MSNQKAQEAYLRETKQLMRSKLEEHGVAITDDTPFRAYVDGIDEAVANSAGNDEELAEVREMLTRMITTPLMDANTNKPARPLHLKAEDLDDVLTIRRYAFYQHYGLTSLEIPENVTSVENSACNGCSNLETLTLPKKIRLQSGCFLNCNGLKAVYLPKITNSSERPILNSDTVFSTAAAMPDCVFYVDSPESLDIYGADVRWSDVLSGRSLKFEGVTES